MPEGEEAENQNQEGAQEMEGANDMEGMDANEND